MINGRGGRQCSRYLKDLGEQHDHNDSQYQA
jgi:hypothetical protein